MCDKTCIFFFFPIINKYFLMAKRSLLSRCPSYIYPAQAVKAGGGTVGIPALILNFRRRWRLWSASHTDLCTTEYRTSVPIELNVGWAPEPVVVGEIVLSPAGIRTLNRPAGNVLTIPTVLWYSTNCLFKESKNFNRELFLIQFFFLKSK